MQKSEDSSKGDAIANDAGTLRASTSTSASGNAKASTLQEPPLEFVLPTKPLTITDAINRMALATGSARNAQVGSGADYNGHCVEVRYNDYRGYWVASYTWSGDHRFARGGLAYCLTQAKAFYETQGRGASVFVKVATPEDVATAEACGFIPAEAEDRSWRDWKFEEVNYALDMERRGFGSYTSNLIAAMSPEDFKARCDAGLRTAPIAAYVKPAACGCGPAFGWRDPAIAAATGAA